MICPFCKLDGPVVSTGGSLRKCAFDSREFDSDNWNCGTVDRLRDACELRSRHTDESIGVIAMPEYDDMPPGWIVLRWYKDRGGTDDAVMLRDGRSTLTLYDALIAIAYATGEVPWKNIV